MREKFRRRFISGAASAACAVLAACTGVKDQGTGWDDAFTYTPPTRDTSVARAPGRETAALETGAPVAYADANNDGKVTKEEAQVDPALAAAFDQYDHNHDGVLDGKEFAQLVADSRERHHEQANGNETEFARMELAQREIGSGDDLDFDAWRSERDSVRSRNPNLSKWY